MGTLNKVFAVRGLLAFLAFIEFVNCSRSLLPRYSVNHQTEQMFFLTTVCPHSLFTLPHERVSESFIQNKIFNLADLSSDVQHLVATLFGFYSLLNSVTKRYRRRNLLILKFFNWDPIFQVVFIHSAIQLHHQHIFSLAFLTLSLKIIFLVSSQKHTSSLTIPLLLTTATLAGLTLVFISNCINDTPGANINENEMLLRAMKKNAKSRRKAD